MSLFIFIVCVFSLISIWKLVLWPITRDDGLTNGEILGFDVYSLYKENGFL